MNLSDFDFFLPEELIALRPAKPRTSSRLLVSKDGSLTDTNFYNLENFLKAGDRIVFNDTRVLKSLIFAVRLRRDGLTFSKANIKFNLLEKISNSKWKILAKPLRKLRTNDLLQLANDESCIVSLVADDYAIIDFCLKRDESLEKLLNMVGKMPIPPYILRHRDVDDYDNLDYQTVFARSEGSVAAPTASLHFDNKLISRLIAKGISISYITLHVGGGTFLPIKTETVSEHFMHSETGIISCETAAKINQTKKAGGRVIAVGTTTARLLESASNNKQCLPFDGTTDIFITPGYNFKIVDGLITNFHLPKSTLIMLVSALLGLTECKELYSYAIKNKYRFFSYGDSSLLIPKS